MPDGIRYSPYTSSSVVRRGKFERRNRIVGGLRASHRKVTGEIDQSAGQFTSMSFIREKINEVFRVLTVLSFSTV